MSSAPSTPKNSDGGGVGTNRNPPSSSSVPEADQASAPVLTNDSDYILPSNNSDNLVEHPDALTPASHDHGDWAVVDPLRRHTQLALLHNDSFVAPAGPDADPSAIHTTEFDQDELQALFRAVAQSYPTLSPQHPLSLRNSINGIAVPLSSAPPASSASNAMIDARRKRSRSASVLVPTAASTTAGHSYPRGVTIAAYNLSTIDVTSMPFAATTAVHYPGTLTFVTGSHASTTYLRSVAGRFKSSAFLPSGHLTYNTIPLVDFESSRAKQYGAIDNYVGYFSPTEPDLLLTGRIDMALDNMQNRFYTPKSVKSAVQAPTPNDAAQLTDEDFSRDLLLSLFRFSFAAPSVIHSAVSHVYFEETCAEDQYILSVIGLILAKFPVIVLQAPDVPISSFNMEKVVKLLRDWAEYSSCTVIFSANSSLNVKACIDINYLMIFSHVHTVYYGPVLDVCVFLNSSGFHVPDNIDVFEFINLMINDPQLAASGAESYRKDQQVKRIQENVAQTLGLTQAAIAAAAAASASNTHRDTLAEAIAHSAAASSAVTVASPASQQTPNPVSPSQTSLHAVSPRDDIVLQKVQKHGSDMAPSVTFADPEGRETIISKPNQRENNDRDDDDNDDDDLTSITNVKYSQQIHAKSVKSGFVVLTHLPKMQEIAESSDEDYVPRDEDDDDDDDDDDNVDDDGRMHDDDERYGHDEEQGVDNDQQRDSQRFSYQDATLAMAGGASGGSSAENMVRNSSSNTAHPSSTPMTLSDPLQRNSTANELALELAQEQQPKHVQNRSYEAIAPSTNPHINVLYTPLLYKTGTLTQQQQALTQSDYNVPVATTTAQQYMTNQSRYMSKLPQELRDLLLNGFIFPTTWGYISSAKYPCVDMKMLRAFYLQSIFYYIIEYDAKLFCGFRPEAKPWVEKASGLELDDALSSAGITTPHALVIKPDTPTRCILLTDVFDSHFLALCAKAFCTIPHQTDYLALVEQQQQRRTGPTDGTPQQLDQAVEQQQQQQQQQPQQQQQSGVVVATASAPSPLDTKTNEKPSNNVLTSHLPGGNENDDFPTAPTEQDLSANAQQPTTGQIMVIADTPSYTDEVYSNPDSEPHSKSSSRKKRRGSVSRSRSKHHQYTSDDEDVNIRQRQTYANDDPIELAVFLRDRSASDFVSFVDEDWDAAKEGHEISYSAYYRHHCHDREDSFIEINDHPSRSVVETVFYTASDGGSIEMSRFDEESPPETEPPAPSVSDVTKEDDPPPVATFDQPVVVGAPGLIEMTTFSGNSSPPEFLPAPDFDDNAEPQDTNHLNAAEIDLVHESLLLPRRQRACQCYAWFHIALSLMSTGYSLVLQCVMAIMLSGFGFMFFTSIQNQATSEELYSRFGLYWYLVCCQVIISLFALPAYIKQHKFLYYATRPSSYAILGLNIALEQVTSWIFSMVIGTLIVPVTAYKANAHTSQYVYHIFAIYLCLWVANLFIISVNRLFMSYVPYFTFRYIFCLLLIFHMCFLSVGAFWVPNVWLSSWLKWTRFSSPYNWIYYAMVFRELIPAGTADERYSTSAAYVREHLVNFYAFHPDGWRGFDNSWYLVGIVWTLAAFIAATILYLFTITFFYNYNHGIDWKFLRTLSIQLTRNYEEQPLLSAIVGATDVQDTEDRRQGILPALLRAFTFEPVMFTWKHATIVQYNNSEPYAPSDILRNNIVTANAGKHSPQGDVAVLANITMHAKPGTITLFTSPNILVPTNLMLDVFCNGWTHVVDGKVGIKQLALSPPPPSYQQRHDPIAPQSLQPSNRFHSYYINGRSPAILFPDGTTVQQAFYMYAHFYMGHVDSATRRDIVNEVVKFCDVQHLLQHKIRVLPPSSVAVGSSTSTMQPWDYFSISFPHESLSQEEWLLVHLALGLLTGATTFLLQDPFYYCSNNQHFIIGFMTLLHRITAYGYSAIMTSAAQGKLAQNSTAQNNPLYHRYTVLMSCNGYGQVLPITALHLCDRIAIWAMNGQMCYAGDIGPKARTLIRHFEKCPRFSCHPQHTNPLSWIFDVLQTGLERSVKWTVEQTTHILPNMSDRVMEIVKWQRQRELQKYLTSTDVPASAIHARGQVLTLGSQYGADVVDIADPDGAPMVQFNQLRNDGQKPHDPRFTKDGYAIDKLSKPLPAELDDSDLTPIDQLAVPSEILMYRKLVNAVNVAVQERDPNNLNVYTTMPATHAPLHASVQWTLQVSRDAVEHFTSHPLHERLVRAVQRINEFQIALEPAAFPQHFRQPDIAIMAKESKYLSPPSSYQLSYRKEDGAFVPYTLPLRTQHIFAAPGMPPDAIANKVSSTAQRQAEFDSLITWSNTPDYKPASRTPFCNNFWYYVYDLLFWHKIGSALTYLFIPTAFISFLFGCMYWTYGSNQGATHSQSTLYDATWSIDYLGFSNILFMFPVVLASGSLIWWWLSTLFSDVLIRLHFTSANPLQFPDVDHIASLPTLITPPPQAMTDEEGRPLSPQEQEAALRRHRKSRRARTRRNASPPPAPLSTLLSKSSLDKLSPRRSTSFAAQASSPLLCANMLIDLLFVIPALTGTCTLPIYATSQVSWNPSLLFRTLLTVFLTTCSTYTTIVFCTILFLYIVNHIRTTSLRQSVAVFSLRFISALLFTVSLLFGGFFGLRAKQYSTMRWIGMAIPFARASEVGYLLFAPLSLLKPHYEYAWHNADWYFMRAIDNTDGYFWLQIIFIFVFGCAFLFGSLIVIFATARRPLQRYFYPDYQQFF